jgi:hypothetical protein
MPRYKNAMTELNPVHNVKTAEKAEVPVATPAVKLDKELIEELMSQSQEEAMVIVHCSFNAVEETGIRIWSSTFLIDQESGTRSRLLHALNITMAPMWMLVPGGTTARFTLLFSALPKSCSSFTLFEDIPQPGGFEIRNIKRNKSDVYNIRIA